MASRLLAAELPKKLHHHPFLSCPFRKLPSLVQVEAKAARKVRKPRSPRWLRSQSNSVKFLLDKLPSKLASLLWKRFQKLRLLLPLRFQFKNLPQDEVEGFFPARLGD